METQGATHEYLPISQTSSYIEQKKDDEATVLYSQKESQIRLIRRKWKGETTKLSEEDEFIRPPLKLQNSRIVRLIIFLALEAMWLGFGLVVYFRPIVIPSGDISLGRISTSSTSLFAAAFGSLGILWQSLALLTIADLVQEIYSGEWHEMVKKQVKEQGQAIRNIDIVSTLVAGRILQARHAFWSGHSTLRYKLAVIITLLLIALGTLAPNAISISSVSSERMLMIGAISDDITLLFPTSLSISYVQLLSEIVRFETVTQLDGSPPEFEIKDANGNLSPNVLFGMPLRSDLGDITDITRLSYISDAIFYNFTCQWLAPSPTSGAFGWKFGGDMASVVDTEANTDETDDIKYGSDNFGVFPLNITDGAGAGNGSLAWFISSFHNHTDVFWDNGQPFPYVGDVLVDLSSIPGSGRTFGNLTQSDYEYRESITLPLNVSTTNTVLFCDPGIKMGTVEVDLSNGGLTLTYRPLEGNGSSVGNIDQVHIPQLLGNGLNGIPWDSNKVTFDSSYGPEQSALGRLTADFLFLPPVQASTQRPIFGANGSVTSYSPMNQTVYSLQSLSDISFNVNSWTSIAGMSTYLSGSMGNHTVPTTGIYATQRLVVNWPQWFANLSIVLVVSSFVIYLTIRDARKGRELVPLTVTTMKKYLRECHDDLEA